MFHTKNNTMNFSLKQLFAFSLVISGTATLAFAGNGNPKSNSNETTKNVGYASYYHDKFNGRKTANGETYDKGILSAAHRNLPLGSLIRVKRLDNGKSVTLRVNDRGPYSNYMVDLSRAAASELGLVGVKRKVQIEVLNTKPSMQDLEEVENTVIYDNDDQQPPVITAESELQRAGGRAHATKAAAAGEAVPEERVTRGRKGRHARGGKHAQAARGGRHAKAARGGKHAKAARGGGKHAKAARGGHKRGRKH